MQKDNLVRLHHMLDAAREALIFAQNKTRKSLNTDNAQHEHGGFGMWQWTVSKDPADVAGILQDMMSK